MWEGCIASMTTDDFVQVYDYVDNYVLMLARMFERRLKGYDAIGYVIERETVPPHATVRRL